MKVNRQRFATGIHRLTYGVLDLRENRHDDNAPIIVLAAILIGLAFCYAAFR